LRYRSTAQRDQSIPNAVCGRLDVRTMVDRLISHGACRRQRHSIRAIVSYKKLRLDLHRHGKNRATRPAPRVSASYIAILHGLMRDNDHTNRWSLGLAVSAVCLGGSLDRARLSAIFRLCNCNPRMVADHARARTRGAHDAQAGAAGHTAYGSCCGYADCADKASGSPRYPGSIG